MAKGGNQQSSLTGQVRVDNQPCWLSGSRGHGASGFRLQASGCVQFALIALLSLGGTASSQHAAPAPDVEPPAALGSAPDATSRAWEDLLDRRWSVREAARQTLREHARPNEREWRAEVQQRIASADSRIRVEALQLLAERAPAAALPHAIAALDDAVDDVREAARGVLLDLRIDRRVERIREHVARWQRSRGYAPLGYDRLALSLEMQEFLLVLEPFRTLRSPMGLRMPNQFAGVLRDRPDLGPVLVRVLREPNLSPNDLGPLWTVEHAWISAFRVLSYADVEPEGARAAIAEFVARNSPQGHVSMFVRQIPLDSGTGLDVMAAISVGYLALARRGGSDAGLRGLLDSWERSLSSIANPQIAWMLASIYIEMGDLTNAERCLQIVARLSLSAEFGVMRDPLPFIYVAAFAARRIPSQDQTTESGPAVPHPRAGATPDEQSRGGGGPGGSIVIRPAVGVVRGGGGAAGAPVAGEAADPETQALDALRTALEMGFSDSVWLRREPSFRALREHPEVQRYLATLERLYPPHLPAEPYEPLDDDWD